jgi:hypothetical protein
MPGPRYHAAKPYIVAGLSLVLTSVLLVVSNGPVHW